MNSLGKLHLRIEQIRREADGVLSFELVAPDSSELPPWEPGAHIDVKVSDTLTRQYSLCGFTGNQHVYKIGVLEAPNSRGGSRHIHQNWRVGDIIEASRPRNNFELAGSSSSYTFLAGGIGITPMLPMVRLLASKRIPWTLAYGGRSRDSMAFLSEIEQLQGGNVQIVEQDSSGVLDLRSIISATPEFGHIYCCGPQPMIEAAEAIVQDLPEERWLRVERFSVSKASIAPNISPPLEKVHVELRKSNLEVDLTAGTTLLEAVRSVLPSVDFSCQEGICGSCEVRVLCGEVDHRDHILTADQRAKSESMMMCVSRPTSKTLVLDL